MPTSVIYEKPEGWPFTMGQTILEVSPGNPPEISYVVDDQESYLRLVATKATEPTHRVRVSNAGGPMGTGYVRKNPQGAGHLLEPQSGQWAKGFFSIEVPDNIDVGTHNVSLYWDNQQTMTVEKREMEHVEDLERAYEITWKVIEQALEKLQHNKYPFAAASDDKERIEYRNRTLYGGYVEEDVLGKPRLSQDFAEGYMDGKPFTDKAALNEGMTAYSKDLDLNYARQKLREAKEVALLRALADLFAALPQKLRPAGAQSYEMLKAQAKAHWHRMFTETARKTQQRDIGFNSEHSGTLKYSHYQNDVIFLKRVPSTNPHTPTDQLISL